jgi:hypothetical protein
MKALRRIPEIFDYSLVVGSLVRAYDLRQIPRFALSYAASRVV